MTRPGFGEVLGSRLGRRHAAGPSPADALAVAADLRSAGLLVTCEYVAHPVRTAAEADATTRQLDDLVHQIGATGLAREATGHRAAVDLLVPSGVLAWGTAGEARLRRLCQAAAVAGTRLGVRPGSVTDVDTCLDLVARVRGEFEDIGVELWASLRRTAGDLTTLLPPGAGPLRGSAADIVAGGPTGGARPRVLLRTTGAGPGVPGRVGLPTATDTDRAFIRYTKRLLAARARPLLAAPDATLVAIVETLADRAGHAGATAPLEFVIDMGRRGDEVTRLSALGRAVRITVPFGPRWRAVGLRQFRAHPPRLARMPRARDDRRR